LNPPANFWVSKLLHQAQAKIHSKVIRRPAVAVSLVGFNVLAIGLIFWIVLQNSDNATVVSASANGDSNIAALANPVDQVSSADIALTIARVGNLPETTAITNQAQSAAAENTMTASSDDVVTKPQVVGDTLKSNADILSYTSLSGDTVSSLATKFNVTSNSIIWSNNLNNNVTTINAGTKLLIPPVNGIIYTVLSGDTPTTLAARFHSNAQQIIAYNDAEISGLQPGSRIIIPNGVESTATTAANVLGLNSSATTESSSGSFPWGSTPIYGYNGYDYGYCTWYVATQIPVPANWGNASTWAYYAALSGWNVSKTPSVGAVGQIGGRVAGGEGHVAVVDAVSPDGLQVQYRDMNGLAGWGRVGYSGWVPASFFDNYISR
jgi:surface antigen